MEDKHVIKINFNSSIEDLTQRNSSFDSGVLKIAYHGKNRKGIVIGKDAFERAIPSLYNCPVVTNYSRDDDTLGDHDVELVKKSGGLKLVNMTHPIGVVPESANVFWQTVTEEDGTEREYLCADALIWKRQEAYSKISEDGISALSMEITINESHYKDKEWQVDNFEFTALTLIGVTPCFESASLEFSEKTYEEQFHLMLNDLKELETVPASIEEDTHIEKFSTEGGEQILKKNLVAEETVEEVFAEEVAETISEETSVDTANTNVDFSLVSGIRDALYETLRARKVESTWGDAVDEYWLHDMDLDLKEVYAFKAPHAKLVGLKFEMDGDKAVIDWESEKRMKFIVAEYIDGEEDMPILPMFSAAGEKINELKNQLLASEESSKSVNAELAELRAFKASVEKEKHESKCEEVFSLFEDLVGVEAFEELKANHDGLSVEDLEDKCFALRGRITKVEFSHTEKPIKIKIEREETNIEKDPYGGLFQKFNLNN